MKKLILLVSLLSSLNLLSMEEKPISQKLSCFNYVKNKTITGLNYITDTVKSDLGLSDKKEPVSLGVNDLVAGCRLFCYTYATQKMLFHLLKKINFFDNMPPQFEKNAEPTAFSAMVLAPILEELLLTHGLANVMMTNSPLQLSPVAAQTLVPLLFGSLHYHDNSKRWAWNIMGLAPLSFYSIRYVLTREKETKSPVFSFAPMISHMMYNMFAYYMRSK